MELLSDLERERVRHRGAARDAGAQRAQLKLRETRVMEHIDEHCGRRVDRSAAFGLDGAQRVLRVEELGRRHQSDQRHGHRDHSGSVRERVVERRWTAQPCRRL